jgi:hypothetical protein
MRKDRASDSLGLLVQALLARAEEELASRTARESRTRRAARDEARKPKPEEL